MKAPEPKKLVVVTGKPTMFIDAEGDGRAWVEQEAPQFGSFHKRAVGRYMLFPRATFDIEDVRTYLESVGGDQT